MDKGLGSEASFWSHALQFATFDCFSASVEGYRERLDAASCLCLMVVWAGVGVEAWFLCDVVSGMGHLYFPREYDISPRMKLESVRMIFADVCVNYCQAID